MHQIKACAKSEIKEDGGIVKGYASTFDRDPDCYGDVIAKGAFSKTLEKWAALNEEGRYIPLLWGHDTENPESNIGRVVNAYEDDRGLFVEAEYDAENPRAQYVRKLVNEGRVYQFSFAFEMTDWGTVELEDGTKANEIREVELFEVSLVQIPANQHATVEESKAAKSGRRNSAKDVEQLEAIASHADAIKEAIDGLLSVEDSTAVGESEREEQSEGAKDQAEFVEAYKSAIRKMIGD